MPTYVRDTKIQAKIQTCATKHQNLRYIYQNRFSVRRHRLWPHTGAFTLDPTEGLLLCSLKIIKFYCELDHTGGKMQDWKMADYDISCAW